MPLPLSTEYWFQFCSSVYEVKNFLVECCSEPHSLVQKKRELCKLARSYWLTNFVNRQMLNQLWNKLSRSTGIPITPWERLKLWPQTTVKCKGKTYSIFYAVNQNLFPCMIYLLVFLTLHLDSFCCPLNFYALVVIILCVFVISSETGTAQICIIQLTPDNSNLLGKSKKVRVIGSLKEITGIKKVSK